MFPLSQLLTTNAFRTRFASAKEAAICLYYETAGFAGAPAYIYSPRNLNLDALLLVDAARRLSYTTSFVLCY